MHKVFSKLHLIVGTLVIGLLLSGVSSCSLTQEGKEEKAETFDPVTAKKLNAAYEAIFMEEYDKARGVLDSVDRAKLSPSQIAQVEQMYIGCDLPQAKYDSARTHMKNAMESGGLSEVATANLKYQLATTYLAQERWKEAIVTLNDFFATTQKPNAAAHYTLAIAYYKSGDKAKALEFAQKAIDISEQPKASWLELLLALRLERHEPEQTIPILRQLIALDTPKKTGASR